ncbi:hypothetical protein [Paenibacillus polymyxa]|uniref:Phage protein n=1 Tax=Paenibacillus polymyxa TaxID=1406 RepID=A0ABX2ZCB3_PAEPO|nr:hypothetical protein [Paenibacillus polymyxa]ODA09116.1 hypothetical protein A7312_27240 [Paenibacillus polymyxa]
MKLTMNDLIQNFEEANGAAFVGVRIKMDGFEDEEVIINGEKNFETKLEYYKNTYDQNLNHKFAKGISISGFTYGCSYSDIQSDLL